MDSNSWMNLFSRLIFFGFFVFLGLYFMENLGWVVVAFVLVVMIIWWRNEQPNYQCPQCKKYFSRDYIEVEVMEKEGWLKSGKTKFTYKCRQCGHKWTRYVATSSVLNSFLNG